MSGKGEKKSWLKYKTGGDKMHAQSADRKDHNLDYAEGLEDAEDVLEDEDLEAYEEAVSFAEDFDAQWDEADADTEIELSQEEMEELEGMAESETLDFDVLNLDEDEDEDLEEEDDAEDDEDDYEDDDDMEEGRRRASGSGKMVHTKRMSAKARRYEKSAARKRARKKWKKSAAGRKSAKRSAKMRRKYGEDLEASLAHIESVLDSIDSTLAEADLETVVSTFANLALVADQLESEFANAENEDLRVSLGEVAAQAAAIAEALHEGEEPNTSSLDRAFASMVEGVMNGLEAYADLSEEADLDLDESDFEAFGFSESEVDAGMRKYGREYKLRMMEDAVDSEEVSEEDDSEDEEEDSSGKE